MTQCAATSRSALPEALYQRLLGDTWDQLDPSVQRAHARGGILLGKCEFDVRHGAGLIAKLIARIARLPRPGSQVPTRLEIYPLEDGCERWVRRFGAQTLTTIQGLVDDCLLVERIGIIEFTCELKVERGGIRYKQIAAALRLGKLRLRMPAWLMPRVSGVEMPRDGGGGTRVQVEVNLPIVGMLLSYDGGMIRTEDSG